MHRYIRHLFWVLIAVAATWSTASQAERRVALVIGNGAYKNVPALPNPPRDATAISALLRNLGFEVVTGTNLNRDGMGASMSKFATAAEGADVALFFYAGHGMSLDGKNYLLPIDANLKSEIDVKLGGPIDVEVMLQQTMGTAKVKLVLLDACRDNPFVAAISRSARSRSVTVASGLSEMKSGEGTLLAFATGPGQVALDGDGKNSPFTKALLNNLAAPGMEIRLALTRVRAEVADLTKKQQLPWENTNLTGFFFMNPTAAGNASTVGNPEANTKTAALDPNQSAGGQSAGGGSAVEVEFWRSVKDSNKPEELNAYITRYPGGAFESIARARVAELHAAKDNPNAPVTRTTTPVEVDPAVRTTDATTQTEDDLGLDRNSRRVVQRRLKTLGFETPTSGKFTEETRRAINSWQSARGYPQSGFLNKLQFTALKQEALPKTAAKDDDEEDSKPARRSSSSRGHGGGGGGGGGPAAVGKFFGGVVGGVLGRR
jgi:Caspase domain/Putative peptidoglycan binding domain